MPDSELKPNSLQYSKARKGYLSYRFSSVIRMAGSIHTRELTNDSTVFVGFVFDLGEE